MRIDLLKQIAERLGSIDLTLNTLADLIIVLCILLVAILVFVGFVISELNKLKLPDTQYREMLVSVMEDAQTTIKLNTEVVQALKTITASNELIHQLHTLNHHLARLEDNDTIQHLTSGVEQLEITLRNK